MTRLPALTIAILAALSGAVGRASAAPDSLEVRTIEAVRATQPINVDGVLDEPVWQQAPAVTVFRQSDQNEGQVASESTEVRVAFDDDALYIGARMWDPHPDSILARMCRRDDFVPSDRFTVFLDPLHDRRSGYYFMVNAAGVLCDGTLFNDSWDDNSWDGVWQARARRDDRGWTAEMRIPFSQLRFRHDSNTVWGVNFRREIQRRTERDWVFYPRKTESGFVSRFPELVGLGDLHPRSSLELVPYATGKAQYLAWDHQNPFRDHGSYKPSGGADLRMSVGSRLTLNATANPDFGQVEVDPAVVNLSDVESYFQEKRPFFVENARIFSFGNEGANDYWGFDWPEPTFFYSRRVGRAPQLDVSNADYADVPVATHILGAGKLTGQLAPGLNVGMLNALTSSETGRLDVGGTLSRPEVEPMTYYGVLRGLREFKNRQHGLGVITTVVERRFDDGILRDHLSGGAVVSGLDGWTFLDRKQVWVLTGYTAMSNVRGTTAQIDSLQQSSRHYFQRPDQDYMSVDPAATSMTGWVARAWVNKNSGKHFLFNSALGAINPKFDTNDIGFQSRSDIINGHLGMGWNWQDPGRFKQWANWIVALYGVRDFGGVTTQSGIWNQLQGKLVNNWAYRLKGGWGPQGYSDTQTRGGPRMVNPASWSTGGHAETDSKQKLYWYADWNESHDASGSWDGMVNPGVEIKPVSNLLLSVGPAYERSMSTEGYVGTWADPVATATYGNRYVFAHLDQTTVSAQIRLNWSFTPNLTFQSFIQPLVASGRYTDFKELARPRSYDFVHYGAAYDPATGLVTPADGGATFTIGNPDFNYTSLRGNAVLRWEYMPGSTLYFVWTQERSDTQSLGEFDLRPDLNRLASIRPSNIFLVKATYYLNR